MGAGPPVSSGSAQVHAARTVMCTARRGGAHLRVYLCPLLLDALIIRKRSRFRVRRELPVPLFGGHCTPGRSVRGTEKRRPVALSIVKRTQQRVRVVQLEPEQLVLNFGSREVTLLARDLPTLPGVFRNAARETKSIPGMLWWNALVSCKRRSPQRRQAPAGGCVRY